MSSQPSAHSTPEVGREPPWQSMPILLGIVFVAALTAAALAGSWSAGSGLKPAAAATPPPATSTSHTPSPQPAPPAPPAPTPVTADDLKAIKGEVEGLASRLTTLATKVDGLPRP